MDLSSWKGKVLRDWSSDGEKGGTILQIAEFEYWAEKKKDRPPLWKERWPNKSFAMSPFLNGYMGGLALVLDDETRQSLLDYVPRAVRTRDPERGRAPSGSDERRCYRAMNACLKAVLIDLKRKGKTIDVKPVLPGDDGIRDRVDALGKLSEQHVIPRELYEVWYGGMHGAAYCGSFAGRLLGNLNRPIAFELLEKVVAKGG